MDEVINYVMDTPGNTNPNVLRGMLEKSSNGSSGGGLVVHADIDETGKDPIYTLDKTGQEILDAYPWVKCVYNRTDLLGVTTYFILDLVQYEVFNGPSETEYTFTFGTVGQGFSVFTTNLNDYPTNREPEEDPQDAQEA